MKLEFEEYPQLAKEATLFLHGNLASTVWWQPTLMQWKEAGSMGDAPLIFADWRGCGKNPPLDVQGKFSLEDLASDVLELVETVVRGPVALVGHSMGGLIALKMMTMAPHLVSRAVLLDPVGVKGVTFNDSMYEAFRQMAANSALTRMVILGTIADGEALPEDFKNAIARDAFKAVGGVGSRVLNVLKDLDLREDVAKLKNPILILHGRRDQIIPMQDSEEMARLISSAELEVVEAGHCWNIEQPKGFVKRLRKALH